MGLCVERSPEMVIGLLGILTAGGAYLPLDPHYPAERLAFMLADAGAPVLRRRGPAAGAAAGQAGATLVRLDADWPADRAKARARAHASSLEPHNTRPTSSTPQAQPEPQKVSSSSIVRSWTRMRRERRFYADVPQPRFLLLSSIAFDSSIAGIFWSLLSGGTLVLSGSAVGGRCDVRDRAARGRLLAGGAVAVRRAA